ncbi:DUF6463 family protein [Sinorhizobium medicae]|uniref:Transmembrane protein n=1 Tax=Sinorhizobium medicae TaxID=110321 RepID=A0A508WUY8_9HYPH|nr:DUF6463 family protein [Sinorhizobium medicae]MBO1960542.1 hypothetical protein [Sinorhizobium medicae]TWA47513.1 hypothetical protein FB008_11942 [Sinorhizobium medicae]WQO54231.1 DUF6463 family protein [Sinorhizobium medicae]WQP40008.1 DUF6463 family protein [Sinorhizobium medicae]VTZ59451.1 conserved membrane hypothetical protein [Sinorhizobium medicae]
MIRWSGIALMVIGILHMVVLGIDAAAEIPGWLRLELWTVEHWQPLRTQRLEVLASNAAFWSTVGSFALPLIMIGALVVWLGGKHLPLPSFLGWSLLAWIVVASLIIEVSGFPLGIPVAICLIIGARRQNLRRVTLEEASA